MKYLCIMIFLLGVQMFGQVIIPHYYYYPVPGKNVGIWPEPSRATEEGFKELKNRWGFSYIFIIPLDLNGHLSDAQYKDAVKAGFVSDNMMVDTWDGNYTFCVDNIPAKYYYLGECVEHDCYGHPSNSFVSHIYSPAELTARKDYVHEKRPDSKFVIDGYKRCSHFITAGGIADVVMYSAYCNWNSVGLPICRPNIGWGDNLESPYTQGSDLQSGSWGDMRSKFGSKFNMSWVRAGADEYNDLFATANQFGFTALWIYQYEGGSVQNLEDFCNAAFQNGWLTRVDATQIGAPTELAADATVPGEIRLSWKRNTIVDKGYIVERKDPGKDYFAAINNIPNPVQAFTDNYVNDTTTYTYRIRAYNEYTVSGYSNEVAVKTLLSPVQSLVSPPDSFINYSSTLTFFWNKVQGTQYYHYQFAADSLFRVLYYEDSLKTDTMMMVGALEFNRTYYWRVGARFATGHTYWSNKRSFSVIPYVENHKVSGSVYYWGQNDYYPVADAEIILTSKTDNKTYTAKADINGGFVMNTIPAGEYRLTAVKNGGWGGVTSVDALNISRFFTGLLAMNDLQICSADFNNNGTVNNSDALLVMKKYVGMIDVIPNNKPEWVFSLEENIKTQYTKCPDFICNEQTVSVGNSDVSVKIYMLCSGDVNGSKTK